MIVALPAQADPTTQGIADRIKRAKATELSTIASELNRQEIQDLQAKAHRGTHFWAFAISVGHVSGFSMWYRIEYTPRGRETLSLRRLYGEWSHLYRCLQ
jgi:hypothetical protein